MERVRVVAAGVVCFGIFFAGVAGSSAGQAGSTEPIVWADLVDRPELWPPATRLTTTISFTSGNSLKAGTVLHVVQVAAKEATVVAPEGDQFTLESADFDLVPAANAYRNSLTPEQRKVDLRAIVADETLLPEAVAVYASLRSETGSFACGSEAKLLKLQATQVAFAKDMITASLDYWKTDLLFRARELSNLPVEKRPRRAYQDSLSPEQKSVTLATLSEDPSLIPACVTVSIPLVYQSAQRPAGSEVELLGIKVPQVHVAWETTDLFIDAADTDLLRRARELRGLPVEKRPSRIPAMLAGTTIDLEGKPVEVKPASYYLFYFSSSTCARCTAYTPSFVERYRKTLANRPEVAVVSLSNNGTAEAALAFARSMGTTWPIVPGEKRRNALNAYHVTLQPGMVVVDRFGRILATNSPGFPALDTVDAVLDELDGILAKSSAEQSGKESVR